LNESSLPDTPQFYEGDIFEAIIYRKALNSVEHLLVENYLSSKYGLDISASGLDRYAGDTAGNGEFDLGVAGIGQEEDGTNAAAFSSGMKVQNNNFLLDNGDYLLFGHRTLANANTNTDLPWDTNTYPNAQRWTRHWYIDVTDTGTTGGTVDIIFDFSDAGMSGAPVSPASNYKLLKRTTETGAFSELATASSISGDQVVFSGVSIADLSSNFTLGTLDSTESPTAIDLIGVNVTATKSRLFIVGLAMLLVVVIVLIGLKRKKRDIKNSLVV
jgi:hypothetical protein